MGPRWMFVVFLAVSLVLPLSGCLRDDTDAFSSERGAQSDDEAEEAAVDVPLRFSPDPVANLSLTETGTVPLQGHCFPVHCLVGADGAYQVPVELSSIVPVGIPVRVEAFIEADDAFAALTGFFRAGSATIFESGAVDDGPFYAVVLRAGTGDSLEFVVEALWPAPAAETGWKLHVEATTIPDVVPERVPTVFDVPDPAAPPRIEAAGGALDLLVWAPDDTFLGRFDEHEAYEEALRTHGKKGAYVLYPYVEVSLVANTSKDPTPLVALAYDVEAGPIQTLDLPGSAQWGFSLDRVPIRVVVELETVTLAWYVSYEVRLHGPDGEIAGASGTCGLCIGGSSGAVVMVGAQHLSLGGHSAEVAVEGGGFTAQHHVIHYRR